MKRPERIEEELLRLRQNKKSIGTLLLTESIMLVLVIVLLFTVNIGAVYALCGAILIFNLLIIRPSVRRCRNELTAMEVMYGAAGDIQECIYKDKDKLDKDTLERDKFVSPREWPTEAICRHSVSGRYIDACVQMCECSFAVKYGSRRTNTMFLSGTYIQAEMRKGTGLSISCISRDIPYISEDRPELLGYGYMPADFTIEKAGKLVWAFSTDGNIPDWFQKQFIKLVGQGSKIMVNLDDDKFRLFIVSRYFAVKHRLNETVSEESLSRNRLPEKTAVFDTLRIIQQNAVLEKRKEK